MLLGNEHLEDLHPLSDGVEITQQLKTLHREARQADGREPKSFFSQKNWVTRKRDGSNRAEKCQEGAWAGGKTIPVLLPGRHHPHAEQV